MRNLWLVISTKQMNWWPNVRDRYPTRPPAEPKAGAHGTLTFCGIPVENHWCKVKKTWAGQPLVGEFPWRMGNFHEEWGFPSRMETVANAFPTGWSHGRRQRSGRGADAPCAICPAPPAAPPVVVRNNYMCPFNPSRPLSQRKVYVKINEMCQNTAQSMLNLFLFPVVNGQITCC